MSQAKKAKLTYHAADYQNHLTDSLSQPCKVQYAIHAARQREDVKTFARLVKVWLLMATPSRYNSNVDYMRMFDVFKLYIDVIHPVTLKLNLFIAVEKKTHCMAKVLMKQTF